MARVHRSLTPEAGITRRPDTDSPLAAAGGLG